LLSQIITGEKASTYIDMLDFLLSVTTIMKTVIGAGILSLPYTISKLGYVLGLLVFVFMISFMQFASILLLKAKNLSKHSNFSTICYHIFRTTAAKVVGNLLILLNNIGICIA
jgi:amino acid permease